MSFPLLLLCLAACLFWPDERLLFGFGLLILRGFAVAITDGMLHKIVPVFNLVSSLHYFGWQSEGTSSQRCFAGKTNKKPITTVRTGFTDFIARCTAANRFTGPNRRNLLDGGFRVAGLNLLYAIRQKPVPNDLWTFFNFYLLLKSYH